MDLKAGFQLEIPRLFIPWSVTQAELRGLLGPHGLREVTRGYFTLACESLGGMRHELGFHFQSRDSDRLHELEFFRRTSDLAASYRDFQTHFEAAVGPPTWTSPGAEGFPQSEWVVPGAVIVHYVIDRFGPEEHMRVRRIEPVA